MKNMKESSLPAPAEEFQSDAIICESIGMYIALPKQEVTFFTRGSHQHKGYEFILPITDMPLMEIGSKTVYAQKYHVIPINPMQDHGVSGRMDNIRFISILFDESYFYSIVSNAFRMSGDSTSNPLLFCNESYPASMELYSLIKIFIRESMMNSPERRMILQNLSQTIAILIFRDINRKSGLLQREKPFHASTQKIEKVADYIKENYQKECTLDELSQIAGLSRFYLIRIFREYTGKTPYDYLLDIRIEKARMLLAEGKLSVTDICHECGFNNMSHFIRTFKKKIGITPSMYKNFTKLEQ